MQRQAMGVALHIVLLPFLELLHSTIDSYDADFMSRLFFCLRFVGYALKGYSLTQEMTMVYRNSLTMSDPAFPNEPIPIPDPIPRPQPLPDPPTEPDPHPITDPPAHH